MNSIVRRTVNSPDSYELDTPGRSTLLNKIYVGFVKEVNDLQRMGRLKVWIPELGGDPTDSATWIVVNYCSPFAGATSFYDNKNGPSYLDTQRSYGMWFVPPDLDNEVVVAFINGDPARGIWMGCLYQQYMNHMVPGIPGQNTSATAPVAEYNKKVTEIDFNNPSRPIYSPLADQLVLEGLDADIVRGVTDSGARRGDPANRVYGLLTPGGNQMVFDDSQANSYIRLRTQSGAQLLINDTVGCIYLNSVDGKNWVSMDATGKIDIYAMDDISIRSQGSINLRGDLDVNIEAGRDINMRARGLSEPLLTVPNVNVPEATEEPKVGPIETIGDEIGLGIGTKINGSIVFANGQDNSTTIFDKISLNNNLKNSTNTILSVGTYDTSAATLLSNLIKIRNFLGDSNFIWIAPYNSAMMATVSTFANSRGDKLIKLDQYPTTDNIHPRDYALVANDAQTLCVPSKEEQSIASNVSTTESTVTTPPAVGQPDGNENFNSILDKFLKPEEGFSSKAYQDGQAGWYAVGYGHNMGVNEIPAGKTFIDAGTAGRVPIKGVNGKDTVVTQEQAEGIYKVDVIRIGVASVKQVIGGAWDVLGPYQQAALTSFAYNAGRNGIQILQSKGLSQYIVSRDIESAAKLIETNVLRSADGRVDLTKRRRNEANLYRQRPDLIGTSTGSTVDGYPRSSADVAGSGYGAPLSSAGATQGGFVKIQSRNDMHFLSAQHIFTTSAKDQHRLTGANLFDTAVGNTNRVSGGYMTESVSGSYNVGAGQNININGARIDLNGVAPPTAVPAANAIGPIQQKETDALVNSLGNVTPILTDTILPHLPFHEPYDNHGGRNFQNIRDSSTVNTDTGLRAGEIIINSDRPLDVYGQPRSDMPPGVYIGSGYNSQNNPLYDYTGTLTESIFINASALRLDETGRQFITSRENGSYRPITVGIPPHQEIGYGHTLTPEEISSSSIIINGLSVTLTEPLTQQNINDLFDQDMNVVLDWMRPLIKIPVTQTQFNMLASLAFNIGQSNFTNSDVLKEINNNNFQQVPNKWMVFTKNAVGDSLPGLVIRRRAEVVQFMQGPANDTLNGQSNVAVSNNTASTQQ